MIEGGNVVHFQEQQEKEQQMTPVAEPPKIQFSRGELTGMGLAICLLGYGLFQQDIPVVFLMSSFLFFEGHAFLAKSRNPRLKNISNILKGMSAALFAGAVIMLLY